MSLPELVIPDSALLPISHERIRQIEATGKPYYPEDGSLLFHGADHRRHTVNAFLQEWDYCAQNGYATDIEAGVGGMTHHDSDYGKPLVGPAYSSRESRSVSIAMPELLSIDFTAEQVVLACGLILATKSTNQCQNLLEKQGVRADLANTGMDYSIFARLFVRFGKEWRNLSGVNQSFDEARDVAVDILSGFFAQDLSYPFETECPLAVKGLTNLARLKRDNEASVSAIAGEDFASD